MESQNRERRAAASAGDQPHPRAPHTFAVEQAATTSWKPSAKDPAPEVKLTNDGQIVEAGYGHGV